MLLLRLRRLFTYSPETLTQAQIRARVRVSGALRDASVAPKDTQEYVFLLVLRRRFLGNLVVLGVLTSL